MAGTASNAPIFRSLNSRLASRRPSTRLRTLTCIILSGFRCSRAETMRQQECSRAVPGDLREERDVLASDHHRLAVAVPDGNGLGRIAVPGEIETAADEPEGIFCYWRVR